MQRSAAEKKQYPFLLDAHAHPISLNDPKILSTEIRLRARQSIFTCFSAGTPKEWEHLAAARKAAAEKAKSGTAIAKKHAAENPAASMVCVSFGIHPWYAAEWDPQQYISYYKEAAIVGEIGLDSLWCDVPLSVQKRCFEKQLSIAADLKKPILLHTKDCEKLIAEMIIGYPYPVCVHWYSGGKEALDALIKADCYFTFAADAGFANDSAHLTKTGFAKNPAHLTKTGFTKNPALPTKTGIAKKSNEDAGTPEIISYMLRSIRPDRVLTETDGYEAILWAYENCGRSPSDNQGESQDRQSCPAEQDGTAKAAMPFICGTLQRTVSVLADAYDLPAEEMKSLLCRNFADYAGPVLPAK